MSQVGGSTSPSEKYTPLRHLATGGMAEIHLALTRGIEGFEKLVIVKRILPNLARDAMFVKMFLDEARVAATLHHPNVVQVYDIGRDEHSHFFTMEFVYGADLSHVLRRAAEARRPPTLDQALSVILGMCAGLHYAHEKEGMDGKALGMVHRDVSPQNVLISFDGAVKLVDFGIAKAAKRAGVTQDGALKGKIAYMSPEQCRSRALDRRSDIFSLSIMLWELTTFRRLFRAPSDFETLEMITGTDAPLPSKIRPDYPAELERIVMKGLQRDPDRRYQTAEEMQLDLEELARELRLVISSVSLGRFMRSMFRDQAEAWVKAQAEGTSFPQFLATCDLPPPSSTTDTWVAPPSEEVEQARGAPSRDTPAPFDIPPLFPVDARARSQPDQARAMSQAEPPPRSSRRVWPLVAGGVMLAGGVAIALSMRGGGDTPAKPTPPPPAQATVAADAAGPPEDPRFDTDGGFDPPLDTSVAVTPPIDAADVAAVVRDAGVGRGKPPKPPKPPPKPPKPPDNGLDDLLPH